MLSRLYAAYQTFRTYADPIPEPSAPHHRAMTAAVTDERGLLLPSHRTFNALYNTAARMFSSRWDEAVRNSLENAAAMEADAYFSALLDERFFPLTRWQWTVESGPDDLPDPKRTVLGGRNPKDPQSVDRENIRATLEACARKTPGLHQLRLYLGRGAGWYGRYGSQLRWDRKPVAGAERWVVGLHDPVHGDKIHYGWNGCPAVLVNVGDRADLESQGYRVEVFDSFGPGVVLDRPAVRRRFVVHSHVIEDAAYLDAQGAAKRFGTGLRHYCYWSWWLRDEMLSWLVDFMEKVGNLGLMIFPYPEGNPAAEQRAKQAAKDIKTRSALAVPVPVGTRDRDAWEPTLLPANVTGAQFLKDIIADYAEKHVERKFVGQTLSSGSDGAGLSGSSVADLHADTKFNLVAFDAENQAETFTRDLVTPCRDLNFPGCPWSFRWAYAIPDPKANERLAAWGAVKDQVKVRAVDVYRDLGYTQPDEGEETFGGPQAMPGGPIGPDGQPVPPPPGGPQPPQPGQPGPGQPAPGEPAPGEPAGAIGSQAEPSAPVPGMGELVAAMVRAKAAGDDGAADRLAEIGADPEALAGLVDDLDAGGGQPATYAAGVLLTYEWSAARTKSGKVKAVGTGEHAGKTLYGKRAEAALARKDKGEPEPAPGPKGAAAAAAAVKQSKEPQRDEARRAFAAAVSDPASVRPEQVESLRAHLDALTRDELREAVRSLDQRTGGKLKRDLVDAMLAHVGAKVAAARPPAQEPVRSDRTREARPSRSTGKKSLPTLIAGYGGINPDSFEFLKSYPGVAAALENGIPLTVFRKTGMGLDQIATEMESDGHFQTPPDRHPGEYLLELVREKVESQQYAAQVDYDAALEAHYREMEDAQRHHDEREVAEAVRVGEAAGDREAAEGRGGPGGGSGEDTFGGDESGTGEDFAFEANADDGFEFGLNADPEPAEPPMRDPLLSADRQLDMFGGSSRAPRPAKPAIQNSLISREVEKRDDVRQVEEALEGFKRAAGNDESVRSDRTPEPKRLRNGLVELPKSEPQPEAPRDPERDAGTERAGGGGVGGEAASPSRPVAAEAGRPGDGGAGEGRAGGSEPARPGPAQRVPAPVERVNARIDRFASHFRSKGQHEVAGWLDKLRDHVAAVGVGAALESLGADRGPGDGSPVQYEGGWNTDRVADFVGPYLARTGITLVNTFDPGSDANKDIVSSLSPSQGGTGDRGRAGDYLPADPTLANKLEEAKRLPGLESSEDVNVIAGKPVTALTPDVTAKLDEKYGKGKWIVKAYGDDAAAGYGIFFPQRAEQIKRDAQATLWAAGEQLAKYGFSLDRDESGTVVGLVHAGGGRYPFGSAEYESTIDGDARHCGDKAAAAAADERGASLPGGGKEFMAQPAFDVVGISDADRAAGMTIKPGQEGRVHVVTRNGKAELVPHSTWLKMDPLPVVFETDDTRAMAQAGVDAINALPESERAGQIYAPDVVRTATGYKVVEANPANHTGSSGYLGDSPFVIDAYVSHLTGRTPAHVQFIRKLLSDRVRSDRTTG